MKFDFISDMHIEHNKLWENYPEYDGHSTIYPWHLEKKSDVLVIAGDCSNMPSNTIKVLDEAQKHYDHVIFTDGNHEHYVGYKNRDFTVKRQTDMFHQYATDNDKVTFLHGDTFIVIGDTAFIGANGWYDWTACRHYSRQMQHDFWKQDSNDSRCIRFDEGAYPDKMARLQAEQLRQEVINFQHDDEVNTIAVITHTIPHRKGMVPDNHSWGYLNGSYMNCAMESVWFADEAKKIKFWGFGHTHFHCDFVSDGIRFVNNARGYAQERLNDPFKGIIQIDLEENLESSFQAIV